ncbi:MAG: hypothetical protein R6T90_05390 [Dissulfuribacterales bacterium]
MKCPKCGRISFDYLEKCPNCGQDLSEIFAEFGSFAKPDPELSWFSLAPDNNNLETEAEAPSVEQGSGKAGDISGIDVSDLVNASDTDTDAKEIDSSDLETVADDDGFQQALDQVLKDK